MLNTYLSNDVCEIIRKKLYLDFVKYKVWCDVESKWVYIWTTDNLLTKSSIKCPIKNNHDIYFNFIKIVSRIESNNNILIFIKNNKINDYVSQTDFKIINI